METANIINLTRKEEESLRWRHFHAVPVPDL